MTRFNPHMSVMRIKVKQIGDCIRHCGDYGRIYFNHLQLTGNGMQIGDGNGSAFVMLGDADGYDDGKTTIKEIKKAFELIGVEVEIGNEYEPDGEGWEEVSRGIEVSNYVMLDHDPEVGELVRGDFISVKELELIEKHPASNKKPPDGFNPITGLWIAKYIDFGTGNPHTIFVEKK